MKYRKLRIAWSVGWGILCLLLIALWVRSYWRCDVIERSSVGISSTVGVVQFAAISPPSYIGWRRTSDPVSDAFGDMPWFAFHSEPSLWCINAPHWLLILVLSTVAAALWMRSRFSLRTLLIAMTVVAVVLGAVVYAVK